MATPSPLNWNQRPSALSSNANAGDGMNFQYAEDYARHKVALNDAPTGYHRHQQNIYQSGPHKGKTKNQLAAEYTAEGARLGLPSKLSEKSPAVTSGSEPRQKTQGVLTMPDPKPPVTDSSSIDPGFVRQPRQGMSLPSINAPASLLPTIQPPGAPSTAPMASPMPVPVSSGAPPTPAQPNQPSVSAPQLEAQVRAQGLEMQNAGITQRGTDGSVLYNNGASISPTSPTGGRVLTSPQGSGSVTMGPAKTKSFDGMSPAQFGAAAAARQGVGNRFVTPPRLGQPAVAAPASPGPAQQRLAAFTAANPPTLTDQQINQKQQTYKANEDNYKSILAQKAYAAERAKNGPQEILTDPTPQTQDQKDANAAVGYTIRSSITGQDQGPRLAPIPPGAGKPFSAAAGIPASPPTLAPAPKPAGTPLSQVKPLNPVVSIPSTRLQPSLLPSGGSTSIPPLIAGRRAAGGPVQGGQPYLVGEQGPEIVVPDQSGTVIPNHQVPSLRQPSLPSRPRKTNRPTASVVPINPPSLLSTFG